MMRATDSATVNWSVRNSISGFQGRFVGRGNAGEILDLIGPRLGVKAFGVALFADLQRRVDIHLDERARAASSAAPYRGLRDRAK